jgi:GAF domain-containing protein
MALTRYKVVADIAEAVSLSTEYDEVLATVAEQAALAFDLSECCIYEYSPDDDTAVPLAVWSREFDPENENFIGTRLPLTNEPTMQRVLQRRETAETLINDSHLSTADRTWMQQWGEMATLYVPLVFGGVSIGCLELIEKRYVRPFTDYDREFAATVAALAAMAIHSARSRRLEAAQQRMLQALLSASREVASAVGYEEVLTTLARTTAEALEADACYIHLHDPARDAVVWQATWERYDWLDDPDEGIGTVYPLDEHPYDREALATGRLVVQHRSDDDVSDSMAQNLDAWKLETFLTVPAIHNGRPVGILEIGQAERQRFFSDDELELARALGEQAAATLQRRAPQDSATSAPTLP